MIERTSAKNTRPRTGCIVGCLVALMAYITVGVVLVVLHEREGRISSACMANQKTLARALQLYLSDWDDEFPVAQRWTDQLSPYIARSAEVSKGDAFICPAAKNRECSYALSSALSGVKATSIAEDENWGPRTVSIFESDVGWNAAGGPGLLPDKPRHYGGDRYAFVDGTAAWVPRKILPDGSRAREPEADRVIWEPVVREGERGRPESDEDP